MKDMKEMVRTGGLAVVFVLFLAVPVLAVKPPMTQDHLAKGKVIYLRACILCHGIKGEGDGPAAFFIASYGAPRPQNLRTDNFKFRSTLSGTLPTDDDLFKTMTRGVPGFMPSFRGLTEEERWEVIYYIKSFNPKFQRKKPEQLQSIFGHPHLPFPGHLGLGRKLYEDAGCVDCHGAHGKGDGPSAPTLKDYRGLSIPPTDLTNPSSFKNGKTQVDIYRTIMTGLTGTPMPSYAEAFAGMEADLWHLIHYILSLSEYR